VPATLKLSHKAIGAEVRRGTFDVLVDGKRVGSVEMNETIETPVEPGRHTLQVRNGRNSSRTETFDAAEGEVIAFRCTGKRFFCRSFSRPSSYPASRSSSAGSNQRCDPLTAALDRFWTSFGRKHSEPFVDCRGLVKMSSEPLTVVVISVVSFEVHLSSCLSSATRRRCRVRPACRRSVSSRGARVARPAGTSSHAARGRMEPLDATGPSGVPVRPRRRPLPVTRERAAR
jgi:hypothetical protein